MEGTSDEEGDIAVSTVEAITIPPALCVANIDEVKANGRTTAVVMST